jgi:hypothetical protein
VLVRLASQAVPSLVSVGYQTLRRGYLKPDDKIWLNYLLLSCYGSIDRQIPIFNHIIYKNPDRYYTAGLKAALSALCIFAGCFFVLPGDKASYYLEKRRRYHAGGGFI